MAAPHLPTSLPLPPWREAGLRYYHYNFYLRQLFGERIQKVSIDAGFTCPNVDGTLTTGGCTFCDNRSFSPSRRIPRQKVLDQIDEGIRRLKRRYVCDRFMAYFQPATNTYAPVAKLKSLFEEALSHPSIVGLAIGTRPDCVPEEVLALLQMLAATTRLSIEYGMQSMHDRSLAALNRAQVHASMVDAMQRSRGRGFEIGAHLILGIPGETREEMLASVAEAARLGVDSVKLHNLYAVKDTPLGDDVLAGRVQLMERAEYIATLVDALEILPPSIVVERVSGEAPPQYFIAPSWCLDKPAIRQALEAEFVRRDSWQGKHFVPTASAVSPIPAVPKSP